MASEGVGGAASSVPLASEGPPPGSIRVGHLEGGAVWRPPGEVVLVLKAGGVFSEGLRAAAAVSAAWSCSPRSVLCGPSAASGSTFRQKCFVNNKSNIF